MKTKLLMIIGLLVALFAFTGCATPVQQQVSTDALAAYEKFQAQQRTYNTFELSTGIFGEAKIELKRGAKLITQGEMKPLTAMPREASLWSKLLTTIGAVADTGLKWYFGSEVFKAHSRDPVIVEQPPAQVIEVPVFADP